MKHLKSAALLASVALTTMTTGCATVTGGTTQNVSVKTQKATADITGAKCVLVNSKGRYEITTPGSVKVHRAKDDLSVKCSKAGEADATMTIQSSTRKGAFVAGNLVMFGIVGSLIATPIDHATGAQYAYPNDISVSFGSPAVPLPNPDVGVASTAITPHVGTDSTVSTSSAPSQSN